MSAAARSVYGWHVGVYGGGWWAGGSACVVLAGGLMVSGSFMCSLMGAYGQSAEGRGAERVEVRRSSDAIDRGNAAASEIRSAPPADWHGAALVVSHHLTTPSAPMLSSIGDCGRGSQL